MSLKYELKEIKKVNVIELQKSFDENNIEGKSYSGVLSIGDLYDICYSNQRTHFYNQDELILRKFNDKQELFTIEGAEGYSEEEENMNLGFQRRESKYRLKKIAKYIDENDNFFPNTIIISLNNEQFYTGIKERLFIDKTNLDFNKFISFIGGDKVLYNEEINGLCEINFIDNSIKLCQIEENFLYLPVFKLINNEENNSELETFFVDGGEYSEIKGEDIEIKKKELNYYKLAWIIDGQHRVFSTRYFEKENSFSKKVPFTCLINTSIERQADIFITVNNTAKKVDTSLTYDLLPLTSDEKTVEIACKAIYDKFLSLENSPFKGILTSIKGEGDGVLSQANFINELKSYFGKDSLFYDEFKNENLTPIFWLLFQFFSKLNNVYSEAFNDGEYNDSEYAIYRTTGYGALILLFIALVIKYINDNKHFLIENVKKDEGYFGINDFFFKEIKILKENINFKRNKISQFRGKAGQKELANLLKYYLGITDDLSENDIEKVKEHLNGKSLDKTKLTTFELNLNFKQAIEKNYDKKELERFTFIDALNYGIKVGEEKHFNNIIKEIINGLKKDAFYIKSKGKTPYDTLSAVLTHDYKDNFEKLGNYNFKRIK